MRGKLGKLGVLALMSAVGAVCVQQASAADVLVSSDITVSETWTRNNDYILTQVIYVRAGATLTIEPGTVVRGEPTGGANDPGTLVVARGGKILALGTKQEPIVFTNLDDDNVRMSEGTPPWDRLETALAHEGEWGGLILLGRGYVANNTSGAPSAGAEFQIEGLTAAGGLGLYGDCDGAVPPIPLDECDDDDSGVLNYVSIRYGGFNLSANNEINGLTLAAVGRGTEIDYVEVFQNQDDGIEFFGGAAEVKHAVVANVGDDSIDYDEGWRGKMQYVFAMQGVAGNEAGDKGGEHDGGNLPVTSEPLAIPTFMNTTYIGHGQEDAKPGNTVLHIRDDAGGRFYNSQYLDFDECALCIQGTGSGARTSTAYPTAAFPASPAGSCSVTGGTDCNDDTDCPISEVCVFHYQGPDSEFQLELRNNTWWCMGQDDLVPTSSGQMTACGCSSTGTDPGIFTDPDFENTYLDCIDPLPIRAMERTALTGPDQITHIDPRNNGPALDPNDIHVPPFDGFFDFFPWRGAFDDTDNWAMGWSTMDRLGYFPGFVSGDLIPVSADITTSTTFTADNEYLLTQPIYVTSGATLTIEPCTVVRSEPTSGINDPGALIITRGTKINAVGTEDCPIVFTNEDDNNVGMNAGSGGYEALDTALAFEGTWGGVIVLGRGYVANNTSGAPSAGAEFQIEGLTAAGGLGLYGDCDGAAPPIPLDECDDDDSGRLRYISIRYGGFNLSANNEINGLTLGAVGRGTEIDYVEVFQNQDDGIEFFGGAAEVKHVVVANIGDDGIDYDEGWRGKGEFIFVMQGVPGNERSDKAGEHDGGNLPVTSEPLAIPTFSHTTYIGHGQENAAPGNTVLHIRDDAGGRFYNSQYLDFDECALCIQGTGSGARTSTAYPTAAFPASPAGSCSVTGGTDCNDDTDCPISEVCVFHYQGPDSEFQLELRNNTWWCMGQGNLVPTSSGQMTACGCASTGTDPGIFTDPDFENEYQACASPFPIRELQRTALTGPDQITSIDPRVLGSGPIDPNDLFQIPADSFFGDEPDPWRGAFSWGYNWARGWTAMERLGYFATCTGSAPDSTPDVAREIRIGGPGQPFAVDDSRIEWKPPYGANGSEFYDTLRSTDPSDFAGATCVETDGTDTSTSDGASPPAGQAYFYVIRAGNACGEGVAGVGSDLIPRAAASCP